MDHRKIPFLDLHAQYEPIQKDIHQAIERVIKDASFILGKEVKAFEEEFAKFSQIKHVIGRSNGTDALILALDALEIAPGDEVITTPYTFISTAETIAERGAKIVFVDIRQEDFNLDPQEIRKKITPKTKAIIAVHLYGQPARMPEICAMAKEKGIKVIEDSAQAHGAVIEGKPIGTFGDIATFSFYPGKNLGAYGDAGAVATQNDGYAEKMRLLRDHGRTEKYVHKTLGYNARMDGMQAAILRVKLPHLKSWTQRRQEIADTFRQKLKGLPGLVLPKRFDEALSVVHLFVIRHPKRDQLQKFLEERGVATLIHYPLGLHRQPCFSSLKYTEKDFPQTEHASREVLSIPCYPELTAQQIDYITASIREGIEKITK